MLPFIQYARQEWTIVDENPNSEFLAISRFRLGQNVMYRKLMTYGFGLESYGCYKSPWVKYSLSLCDPGKMAWTRCVYG